TAITTDIHQTLDVHLDALTQITFDLTLRLKHPTNLAQLVFTQVSDTSVEIHSRFFQNGSRTRTTNSINVGETNLCSLVGWEIYACYTCHLISRYPCLCLCLGLTQITRTTPLRWMILHLSHIFLTDARTFISKPQTLYL